MQTRREYLVGQGLAKAGRGKFSTAAKAALDVARAKGVKFSDDDTPAPRTAAPVEVDTAPVSVDPRNSNYLFQDEYRFPESEYKGIDPDGKEVSLRECCNTCRVSLLNHACNAPTIHGNVVVRIIGRKVVHAA